MYKEQENKFTMFLGVDGVLEKNGTTISANPGLEKVVADYRGTLRQIQELDLEYRNGIAGATASKKSAKEAVITNTMKMAGALSVIARKTGNADLAVETAICESRLEKTRDTELSIICSGIADRAIQYGTELEEYGISRADSDAFKATVDAYDRSLKEREVRLAGKKVVRIDRSSAFRRASAILRKELDSLMELVKESNPDFYGQYFAARNIRHLGINGNAKNHDPQEQIKEAAA
jgi:hypothetical protein